ncbi:MAG: pirin family protein [Myxococcota bacterium]
MTIALTIPAQPHALGALTVRRVLPGRARQMVGPFIFMETGGPADIPRHLARGVPEHPHAGLSTFTYLIEGAIHHRDSAGFSETIRAGDIALMTAGRGIAHEELPADPTSPLGEHVHFAQMWLALPDKLEEMAPAFEFHRAADLPERTDGGCTVRIAMGTAWGLDAPTTCHVPTLFADLRLDAGAALELQAEYEELAILVLEGDAVLGDTSLSEAALHILKPQPPALRTSGGCRALLLGGARFASSRVIGGSFVASTEDKLRGWMRQAQLGKFPRIPRPQPLERS